MTLRVYLFIMAIATSICWIAFVFILRTVDPTITNLLGFALFYISLFLSLSGTAAIIGFLVRFVGLKREMIFFSVKTAFRQSFLFAFLIIAILFLSAHNWFTWLNLFLLVVGLSLLEFFLINYNNSHSKQQEATNE
jgi:hypothetical protein